MRREDKVLDCLRPYTPTLDLEEWDNEPAAYYEPDHCLLAFPAPSDGLNRWGNPSACKNGCNGESL